MSITKAFKTKWVKALRSGKYKQARGELKLGRGYCCLGVACRLLGITPRQMQSQRDPLGLKWLAPIGLRELIARKLAHMNDAGETFSVIADYIENNLDLESAALKKAEG